MTKKNKDKTVLKKGVSQFNIIGRAKVNDNTFSIDNESQTSDWIYSQMQLGVDVGDSVVFSSLMGGYGATRDNVIYVHGIKKNDAGKDVADFDNRFTIDWDDRFDEAILKTVADDCFIRVGVEKDVKGKTYVKKFLSAYDAVEYLSEHLEDGAVVNISGVLQYQYYNENVTVQKNIKSIYLSTKEEQDFKAEFRQTILLDSDSIGKLDKEKNTYPIDAYVVDYVSKVDGVEVKQNVVFPKTFNFDVIDTNNPEKTAMALSKFFKPKKKNSILELGVIGKFCEGGVISTTTLDELDEDIKMMVDLGMISEQDALAKYTNGQKERRMVIKEIITKNDSDDPENKHLVVMRDEDKYTPDDLVFISQFIDTDEDEADDESEYEESVIDTESNDNESDDDWISALMND